MTYSGLDHVGSAVGDLDCSVEWYTFFLGEPPLLRKTWDVEYVGRVVGYPAVRMEGAFWRLPGGMVLELLEYLDPRPRRVDMETYNAGNGHLCLVLDDLAADSERLRGHVVPRPRSGRHPVGPVHGRPGVLPARPGRDLDRADSASARRTEARGVEQRAHR